MRSNELPKVLFVSWSDIASWFSAFSAAYGNQASVLGTALTIIGFILTLWQIRKARSAAEQAQSMAREAIDKVSARLFVGHVSDGVRLATELANACRLEQWERAIDRCEQLLLLLSSLVEDANLTTSEKSHMVTEIDDMSLILRRLEEIVKGKKAKMLTTKMEEGLVRLRVHLGRLDGRLKRAALEIRHE